MQFFEIIFKILLYFIILTNLKKLKITEFKNSITWLGGNLFNIIAKSTSWQNRTVADS